MANNSFIPSSDLNFDGYKESLKTFLRQQDRFADYNFEGSNLGVLIDLLTYNTVNNAHYLNMIGSESFLDSASLRSAIVSRAKELNYTPRSRVSAHSVVDIEIVPNDAPSSIVVPKNYRFKTTNVSGRTLSFLTTEAHTVRRDAQGRYQKTGIELREGELVTETFDVTALTSDGYTSYETKFILQSEDIDVSSIEVQVFPSSTATTGQTFTRAYNVYGLTGNSPIFFVRGYRANQYEVEFGDGTFGQALKTGNRVVIKYRDTVGAEGNGRLSFSRSNAIQGYSSIAVTVTEYANGGAERESNESIQFNAPRHYQTQERGVIDSDFKALMSQNFPEVQDSHVYGGEKVKMYGNVIVAVKPIGSLGRASTNLKKRIKNFLETKTLTTRVFVEDPAYFVLKLDGTITYDLNLVTTNTESVRSAAIAALKAYETSTLGKFGVTIFTSKLEAVTEAADPSIIGSQIDLKLVYQWLPSTLSVDETLTLNLNNPLETTSKTEIAVSTSNFYVIEDANPVLVYVKDDGQGTLKMYRAADDTLKDTSIGTVNYETGEISARLNVSGYDTTSIDWTCVLADRKVNIDLNQFAIIDTAYIDLTMVEG